jgi:hypothetical protein
VASFSFLLLGDLDRSKLLLDREPVEIQERKKLVWWCVEMKGEFYTAGRELGRDGGRDILLVPFD